MHAFSLSLLLSASRLSVVYDLPEKEETFVGVHGMKVYEGWGYSALILNLSTWVIRCIAVCPWGKSPQ
jgi:hypothetical protein